MCGRYTLTNQEDVITDMQASLDVAAMTPELREWWKPRFNVAPTQPAPVVTLRDGARVLELMRWGLLPFGASQPGTKPPLMINARVESAFSHKIFKDLLARKRCLVPADGFFEWLKVGKKSSPRYIHPEPRHVIAFAGMWSKTKLDSGREVHSFSILTGPPNELVRPIHDRMPVVLSPESWAAWLDPETSLDDAHALLGIPSREGWVAEPVSTRVNAAANDDPMCIEVEPAEAQGSLF